MNRNKGKEKGESTGKESTEKALGFAHFEPTIVLHLTTDE